MFPQNATRLAIAALAGIALSAGPVLAASKATAEQPKISMSQARQIALKTYPATVMKEELEHENGGLRYSFDLRKGKRWREVGVDAMSGKVVENKAERPNPKD